VLTIDTAKAHWVNRDTIAWTGAEPSGTYRLFHSPTGQIITEMSNEALHGPFVPLSVDRNGLPQSIIEKFSFLKDATALKIPERDSTQVPGLLKGELVLAKMNNAASAEATTLILAGVLDDLFFFNGELGARRSGDEIQFRLWAPTARSVRLFVYDDPDEAAPEIYPMLEGDAGVWEVRVGDPSWLNRKYYVYEVEVFSRQHARIVTNVVTDPYSVGLAPNSSKSRVFSLRKHQKWLGGRLQFTGD
jgi:pullulanase